MKAGARRIPDILLERYLADEIEPEERARLEATLAESPADQARIEVLLADSAIFILQHPPTALCARGEEEKGHGLPEHDRVLRQNLLTNMQDMVNQWRSLDALIEYRSMLEQILLHQAAECIVMVPSTEEIARSTRVTMLVEKWFEPGEKNASGLPTEWLNQLASLVSHPTPEALSYKDKQWKRRRSAQCLWVTFLPLPKKGARRLWGLAINELPSLPLLVPEAWRKLLEPYEVDVLEGTLRGWNMSLIADFVGGSRKGVVSSQWRILEKLGLTEAALKEAAASLRQAMNIEGALKSQNKKGPSA